MLGILIGITAVILTVGIGRAPRPTVRDQINALGTNLLVVSPGSHHRPGRRPRRVRSRLDAHRRRRRCPSPPPTWHPTSRRWRRWRRRPASLTAGDDQLDHDPHRHHGALAGRAVPRASRPAGSSPTPTRRTPPTWSCSGSDTASRAVRGPDPVGQQVTDNGTQTRRSSACSRSSARRSPPRTTTWPSCPLSTYQQKPRRRSDARTR